MSPQEFGSVFSHMPVAKGKVLRQKGVYQELSKATQPYSYEKKDASERVFVREISRPNETHFNMGFVIEMNDRGYRFTGDQIDVQDKNRLAELKRESIALALEIEDEKRATDALKERDKEFQLMRRFEKTLHIFGKYTHKMSDLSAKRDVHKKTAEGIYFKKTIAWEIGLAELSHEMARLFLKVDFRAADLVRKSPTSWGERRPVMPVLRR
ncbi:MAG TPA: hypothetical protein EYO51_05270 [Methylococcaceae bacterium]|nr:hypothetical protein [Methylococcaceae bacterium]HIA44937.1 hypothetical protein [Methylococcaceae bacterium]HIB62543.1 hypothetical protein [Methylococcaceae bacterium]HIN67767.1 hypothetical protein [Methylococcales bacterium]HIO43972.1 hypothetical protein [Methylococcales bacterium]